MALFGSNKPKRDWDKTLATFFYGTDYMDRREQKAAEAQAQGQRQAFDDWMRSGLSPADGPEGSGTGAIPTLEQQMGMLDEARLRNPEWAARWAPVVEARAREQDAATLFANDPKAAMLYRIGNQSFLDGLGEQYKPQVIGAGGRQSVYGEGRTVDAPSFMQFGNQVQRNDPGSGQSVTVARRQPDPVNVAPGGRLLNPETGALVGQGADRVFSAGEGAMLFDERGNQIAENAKLADPGDAAKAVASVQSNLDMIDNTRGAVTRARQQIGPMSTGLLSGSRVIGGTPAANLAATIDTIEANLSFAELAKMRANSPTGGALGGIAVRELELLGATVASLRQSQSQEELERSLNTIDQSLARYEGVLRQSQQQGQQGAAGTSRGPQIGSVEDGYRYRGGDPSNPSSWERVQ
jgi:hypothetical protein